MKIYHLLLFLLLTGCTITGETIVEIVYETTSQPIETYFCNKENCEQQLTNAIENSNKTSCAFYSLNSETIKEALRTKNARITAEQDNEDDFTGIKQIKKDRNGLMHNKFCVIDESIITTGSWNPATNTKTANNLLIIPSKYLAKNYATEFEEMWNEEFKKGKRTKQPLIMLNEKLIENYFCPEDKCARRAIDALNKAEKTIYFMTYSFTDEDIGNLLLKKSKNLEVKGIFDSSQLSEWSQFEKLKETSIVKKGIHHKVFIIDNTTVITGSYNPTKNGNTANDENMLIIHDETIAEKFLKEFKSLLG